MRSAELLLHERIPRRLVFQPAGLVDGGESLAEPEIERPAVRVYDTPDTSQPRVALLGHLPYTIMISNRGSGYSRYEGIAVTRWRADATTDNTGQFCYVKDVTSGHVWSVAHQPVCAPADSYRASFATDRVAFDRVDGHIETRTEITVVPADAAEVRRITVTNNGSSTREIELTSYGEIVLAPPDADRAHPAFANLFVADGMARVVFGDPRDAASALGGGADACGACTSSRWTASSSSRSPARPTARASSDADARRAIPRRSTRARTDGSPVPSAPSSIRSWRSARASGSRPARARRSRSRRSSRRRASARSSWPTATTIRAPRSARWISRGPPRRWSCAS